MEDKEYIVTDQCMYWEGDAPEGYNSDPNRKPHAISLVDPETGTIQNVLSGTRVRIVKARLPDEKPLHDQGA